MSLHIAAQHLASKGRNGDTELVHMTKGEIKGLQGLALAQGGSLSINPDTGLVEASFLKNLLPTIAGIGLSVASGGTLTPLMAAGIVGGGTALATGDISKGLMAGLGAYGGAGLGAGLSSAGASSISGQTALADATSNQIADAATTTAAQDAGTRSAFTGVGGELNAYDTGAASQSIGFNQPPAAGQSNIGQGINQLGSSAGRSAVYNALPTGTLPALGATALNATIPEAPAIPGQPEEEERYKGSPYRYNLASNFSGATPTRPNPYYRPTGLGYAEGGDVMMAAGGTYDDEPMGDMPGMAMGGIAGYAAGGKLQMKTMSLGDGIYKDTDDDTASLGAYDAAMKRMEKQYAAANLKAQAMPKSGIAKLGQIKPMAEGGSIGGYSDGGRMLKGPGDGMSDSIPATIGKRQPARLADGEFVVPADVVSHLGNGSTDAGAKRLYSMMDKVRKARTGKKKQAPAVKVDKYMPA